MLGAHIPARQWKIVRQEIAVSTLINAFIPAGIIYTLNVSPPAALTGANGIALPLTQAAGLATFFMTLLLSFIIYQRVKAGGLPPFTWPKEDRGIFSYLPKLLILRAIALAVVAIIILVPIGFAVAALLHIVPLTRIGFLIFNILYGSLIGMVMATPVVLTALADTVRT